MADNNKIFEDIPTFNDTVSLSDISGPNDPANAFDINRDLLNNDSSKASPLTPPEARTPLSSKQSRIIKSYTQNTFLTKAIKSEISASGEPTNNTSPEIDDPVRYLLGGFWVYDDNKNPEIFNSNFKPIGPLESYDFINDGIKNSQRSATGSFSSTISLKSRKINLEDYFKGEGDYDENILQGTYEDFYFEHASPLNSDQYEGITRTSTYSYSPVYNFYASDFERITLNGAIEDKVIPNIYSLMQQGLTTAIDETVENHNTLSGTLDSQFENTKKNVSEVGLFTNSEYLKLWSQSALRDLDGEQRDQISDPYQSIFFRAEDQISSPYKRANKDYKELFPFYNQVKFDTDVTTDIAQLLDELNYEKEFLDDFQVLNNRFRTLFEIDTDIFEGFFFSDDSIVSQINSWDLNNWVESLNPSSDVQINPVNNFQSINFDLVEQESNSQIFNELHKAVIYSKIVDYKNSNFRTYKEVLSGKPAPSEIMMYKVSKFKVSDAGDVESVPEQNIWFMNSNRLEMIDYIDTQVKYDTNYIYRVFAEVLVLGNEFEYDAEFLPAFEKTFNEDGTLASITPDPAGTEARLEITNKPSFRIFERELFETSTKKIQDDAPLDPDVEFNTYKDIDDQILITLSKKIGNKIEEPVIIQDIDEDRFDIDENGEVEFRSDSIVDKYELFRLAEVPESYEDFAEGKKVTLRTSFGINSDLSSDRVSFKDSVNANQEYYYTFRAIDIHSKLSNPTKIYVVKLTSESGLIIPDIEVKDIEELKEKQSKPKNLRRYLKIQLPLEQFAIDIQKSKLENAESALGKQIKLGMKDEKTWGKNYKMRLTSKSTGKKLDINFKFDYNQLLDIDQKIIDSLVPGSSLDLDKESISKITNALQNIDN